MKKICGYAIESIKSNEDGTTSDDDASIIEIDASSSFDEFEVVAEEEENELIETTLDSARYRYQKATPENTNRVYAVPDDTMDTDLDFSDFDSDLDEFYDNGYRQPTNHEATERNDH